MGVYDEPVEGWRGQIQSALSDHFFDVEDGCGFLIEATGRVPGAPRRRATRGSRAQQHKQLMQTPALAGALHHGGARPRLGRGGARRARPRRRALGLRRRGGRPAGRARARRSWRGCTRPPGRSRSSPRTGASAAGARARTSTRYLARLESAPLRAATTWPASPRTRWARAGWARTRRPRWPTAAASSTTSRASGSATRARSRRRPGVNPMVTIMTLAHRTAGKLVAAGS